MVKIFNSYYELKKHFEKISMPRPFRQEIEKVICNAGSSKKIKYKYSNSLTNLKIYIYIRKIGNKFLLITNMRSVI